MKLVLSKNSIINTTFCDESTGQLIYQTRTAAKTAGNRTTVISRVRPNSARDRGLYARGHSSQLDGASDMAPLLNNLNPDENEDSEKDEGTADEEDEQLDLDSLAEIHWSVLGPSKMRLPYTDQEVRTSEYLHYSGFLWQ
jgi:hypothetical protein